MKRSPRRRSLTMPDHDGIPAGGNLPELAAPNGLMPHEAASARRLVAAHAHDATDALDLMDALGILPEGTNARPHRPQRRRA